MVPGSPTQPVVTKPTPPTHHRMPWQRWLLLVMVLIVVSGILWWLNSRPPTGPTSGITERTQLAESDLPLHQDLAVIGDCITSYRLTTHGQLGQQVIYGATLTLKQSVVDQAALVHALQTDSCAGEVASVTQSILETFATAGITLKSADLELSFRDASGQRFLLE